MYSLTRNFLEVASAAAVVALTALSTPAANEMVQNLGPVPAYEPILKTVGNQNVLAFFEPGNGQCNVQAVIWNVDEIETNPTRVQVSLYPVRALLSTAPRPRPSSFVAATMLRHLQLSMAISNLPRSRFRRFKRSGPAFAGLSFFRRQVDIHGDCSARRSPLSARDQTSSALASTSAKCQKRTSRVPRSHGISN